MVRAEIVGKGFRKVTLGKGLAYCRTAEIDRVCAEGKKKWKTRVGEDVTGHQLMNG